MNNSRKGEVVLAILLVVSIAAGIGGYFHRRHVLKAEAKAKAAQAAQHAER